jgi:hypothetical protein
VPIIHASALRAPPGRVGQICGWGICRVMLSPSAHSSGRYATRSSAFVKAHGPRSGRSRSAAAGRSARVRASSCPQRHISRSSPWAHGPDFSKTLRQPRIVLLASDYPMVVTAGAVWLSEIRPPRGRGVGRCERWQPGRTNRVPGSRDGRVSPPQGDGLPSVLGKPRGPGRAGGARPPGTAILPSPRPSSTISARNPRVLHPRLAGQHRQEGARAGRAPQRSKTNTE